MRNFLLASLICILAAYSAKAESRDTDWKAILGNRLSEYGHRNWIVVADAAYPKQSSPGIETIHTGENHLEVLRYVMEQIEQTSHIRPIIMLDEELQFVSESASPGVKTLRSNLKALFGYRNITAMPHEDIITKLDKGSELFNVLLLKTNLTIPYTSVFLELDCGYWDEKSEIELREKFNKRNH